MKHLILIISILLFYGNICSATYEDLSTYSEVDPNNRWEQTTTRNTGTSVPRDEESFVYKDYTIDHFGDFEHLLDINASYGGSDGSRVFVWMLANDVDDYIDQTNAIAVNVYANTENSLCIYIYDKYSGNQDSCTIVGWNTTWYLTINRTGTTLNCTIYDDSDRTSQFDHLTIVCNNSAYRYAYVGSSWNSGDVMPMTVYCENFDLQEAAVGTPDPINLAYTRGNTWVNWTWDDGSGNVTDSNNVSINGTWHNGTTNNFYNHTGLSSGDYSEIIVYAWNSTYNELSSGYVTDNVSTLGAAPSITAYYPIVTIWPEVADSQMFNVTTDQTTNCTWYINGSQVQYNSSATEHTYTNTSLKGGHWNFTAVVNNTNGTDSQTWLFEVGADSIDTIILSEDDTNLSCLIRWNVTRIGSNVTHWNVSYSNTTNGYTYYFRFDNLTEILSQTATGDNQTLWFNSSTLLPTGIYRITSTPSVNTSHLLTSSFETSLSLAGILVIIAIVIGIFSMLAMMLSPTSKMDFLAVGTAVVSVIVLLSILYIAIILCNSIANA